MKQLKMLLLASMVMLFTACGGGSSSVDNTSSVYPQVGVRSAKVVTKEAKITGLYIAYFNRAADQEGLKYWTDKADEVAQAGGDESAVFKTLSEGFATHPTFKSTYDHLNNEEFVSLIYRNVLGRDGDAEGIAYWTDLLDRGIMLRPEMVASFVELSLTTDLTKENYPNLSDAELVAAQLRQDLITNKVTVALAFTKQLGVLSNVADSQNPEDDPAYLASIKIISEVTEDSATVSAALAFFDSIIDCDDPIARINEVDHISPPVFTIDAGTSTLAASPASVAADGSMTSTITITVKDANSNLITGATVTLAQGSGASTISAVTNNGDGTYTFTVSSTTAETVTYTATADCTTVTQTANVTFSAGWADAGTSTVTASPASVVADGSATSTITVTVKNANSNPVTGATVSLAQTGSSTISAVTNVGDGTYTFTVSSTTAETVTYTATADSVVITQTADVTFTAGGVDAGTSTVTASPASVAADGSMTSTITITVKNANSNPVTGATVSLAQTGSSTISAVTNVGDGTYTFTVSSTTAETVTYTATADSVVITQTANVTFTATFPEDITIDNAVLQKVIVSTFDNTPLPGINIQGVIDTEGLTVSVPYTVVNTPVTLPAYSTSVILDASVTEDSEAGIVATFAWTEQTDLPVGSGFFTATITIDDSAGNADDTYNAKKLDIQDDSAGVVAATFPYTTDAAGGTGTLTLKIMPGIPDRMFGLPDNNGDDRTHEFLYVPVINMTTGKTWLSNNLGANYANINSLAFDITQQATASNDHNAYGSLFQWGRKADGHELITWTDGSTGTGTNGTTTANSDDPADTLFITEGDFPYDWRVTQDDTLWASESSTNNVCPVGYRVPTGGELDSERLSWSGMNAAGALASTLVLPIPGIRDDFDGSVDYEGWAGHYWGSTISGLNVQYLDFGESLAYMSSSLFRANGFTVRCIKAAALLPEDITIDNAALQKVVASTSDDTPLPGINIQGVIDTEGLTVSVPYTVVNAPVTVPAYSTSVALDASVTEGGESGIVATFAWTKQTDLPVGSGFFTATITIDDSAGNEDDIYNAKRLDIDAIAATGGLVAATFPYAIDDAGGTGTLTLKIMPGIPDRMFGLPDNNGDDTTHEFLYVPVYNMWTGKTWLSNNLGANYANINSLEFDITQQATASDDHNAYGSLFQWGRKADGHELITWTDGSEGTGVNGTTTTNSDDPTHALFITQDSSPKDWRVTQDDTLWASESSANNICPVGYRVPTGGELDSERLSWPGMNAAGALASTLALPMPGYRGGSDGTVYYEGWYGLYWGSTVTNWNLDIYPQFLRFTGSDANVASYDRANGVTVRCLKVSAAEASNAVLAQIGAEGDTEDTVNSVVTVAQLGEILPALTGIDADNETAYQDYIDTNPELFSSPATQAEVQAMINAVNAGVAPLPADITIDNATLQKVIASTFDNTPYDPAIDIQGVIDAGGLTVSVPYTVVTAPVTLPAHSTSVTLDALVTQDDEVGIVATFAWEEQTDLPVGSGSFTATITIDDSAGNADDTYNAKKLDIEDNSAGLVAATFLYATDDAGGAGVLTLKIMPGIPDRMFGVPDNNGDDRTHEFLYIPVTNMTTGKTWLSNNLGANYANINSPEFDIRQQATASDDHNAYGSLFQWGRKADGHELMNWASGSEGTGINGITTANSDDPADTLFITEAASPWDWRETQDVTLWASESSPNNVCPVGYRVPAQGELNSERESWPSTNAAGALVSVLALPIPGRRDYVDGSVKHEGAYDGYYWGSNVFGWNPGFLGISSSDAIVGAHPPANGFTVRCLKD